MTFANSTLQCQCKCNLNVVVACILNAGNLAYIAIRSEPTMDSKVVRLPCSVPSKDPRTTGFPPLTEMVTKFRNCFKPPDLQNI